MILFGYNFIQDLLLFMEVVFTDTQNTLLDGKYLILDRLGQGAYGEVFLTRHTGLGVYRAVKRISRSRDIHDTRRREADALKSLSHSSLPIIYDIDEDDVYFYIVEEYIRGTSLGEYVRGMGRLTEDETRGIAMSLCDVLEYMNTRAGLFHLDIKPENVMVTDDGIRLVDFGSSYTEDVQPGVLTGTVGYAAPELYNSGKPNRTCDIYSLGMLMRFMLTGETPNYNISNICSENLEFIINKCTALEAGQRYATAAELYRALEQSQSDNRRTTAEPTVILVAGCGHRVGATHFAVMLAAHFTLSGRKCLLEPAAEDGKSLSVPLYGDIRHIGCRGGVYTVNGITVVPDYHGYAVPMDNETYGSCQVVIKEVGNILDMQVSGIKGYMDETYALVLVAGHTFDELLDYEKAAAMLDEAGINYVSAVNYTDGRGYGGIIREHGMKRALRIPYCTEPYSFKMGRGIIEKTIIPKWSGENEGNRIRRNAKRLWNDTLCLVHRQLSVKCKKKPCDGVQNRNRA